MFLLGAVYVVLAVVLFYFLQSAILMILIVGGLAALNLFASDKLALAAMGGRVVTPQEAPQLHAMVERLCVQADLPKPKVAVANTAMPNAFALGRSPKNATVCATTGIMELLSPAELEGVMAHELTHVANRDVMVMTFAAFFATIAAYIVQFGFFFGGGRRPTTTTARASSSCFLVSMAVYVVSFILMQALSRYREFAADRGAALITGRPSALASALHKISGGMAQIPQKDLRAAGELNAFFIFPAGVGKGIGSLFATHPPMEKRIAALAAARGAAPGQPRLAFAPVGFLDILRGKRELKQPAADRLFAMSTAYVKLEMELEMRTPGKAAIVFQPLATADFEGIVKDMEEVVRGTGEETGTTVSSTDDEFGYRWMILVRPRHGGPRRRGQRRSRRRSRPAATATACCAPCSRCATSATSASTGSTTTSAARSTRSCPRAARSSATTSASCG